MFATGKVFRICKEVLDSAGQKTGAKLGDAGLLTLDAFRDKIKTALVEMATASAIFKTLLEHFSAQSMEIFWTPYDQFDYNWFSGVVNVYDATESTCTYHANVDLEKQALADLALAHPKKATIVVDKALRDWVDGEGTRALTDLQWIQKTVTDNGQRIQVHVVEARRGADRTKKLPTDYKISLVHELIHAYHYLQKCYVPWDRVGGAWDSSYSLLRGTPFGYKEATIKSLMNAAGYASTEEFVTIGVDSTKEAYAADNFLVEMPDCVLPFHITENLVRSQATISGMDLPPRVSYQK